MFRHGIAALGCALFANSLPLAAAELASPTQAAAEPIARTAREFDKAVHDALRSEAAAKGADREAAARKLLALYQEVDRTQDLSSSKRTELLGLVGRRLQQTAGKMKRRTIVDDPRPAKIATADRDNLAQQIPAAPGQRGLPAAGALPAAPGGGLGAATQQQAQELIDLIESTVMPSSWQTNGGTGVIRYFAAGMVLVISATDQTHREVGGLIGDLRK